MNIKQNRIALALIPALLAPVTVWLVNRHEPNLLFGLSSSFFAGTAIGVSIVSLVASVRLLRH